jgi:hypothetical protein
MIIPPVSNPFPARVPGQRSDASRQSASLRGKPGLTLLIGAALLCFASSATAQEQAASTTAAPAPAPVPSLIEMKAAAYDAQVAAQQAQAAAASAQEQAAKATAAVQAVTAGAPPAPAPAPVATTPAPAPVAPPPAPTPVAPAATAAAAAAPATGAASQAEVQRAMEKAEQAAAEARRTREELDALKEAQRMRYARRGLTVSVGAFYAPQIFDINANVENSKGLYGGIGYRVHPHFSIESNFNWVQGFATDWTSLASGTPVSYSGDLAMWSATVGGRFYILTKKIQPYLGFGVGASGAKGTFTAAGAQAIDYKEFSGNISFDGGIELYLSDSLAVGADAAIYLPGGDLGGLNYSTLGGKLIYRF